MRTLEEVSEPENMGSNKETGGREHGECRYCQVEIWPEKVRSDK